MYSSNSPEETGVGGRKGIRLPIGAQGDVLRRPLPDPGNFQESRDRLVQIAGRSKKIRIRDGSLCNRFRSPQTCSRHGKPDRVIREPFRCRKCMSQLWVNPQRIRDDAPVLLNQLPCVAACSGNSDLLPKHSSHRNLKSIPSTRSSQARAPARTNGARIESADR